MSLTIAFDLDGTLIDSVPQIAASVNTGLAKFDIPALAEPTVKGFVGRGFPKLIEQVIAHLDLPADHYAPLHDTILQEYVTVPTPPSVIYPGALGALNTLRADGHSLTICTNKPYDATVKCLDDTGLAPLFDRVIGGDSLPTRKPDPAMLFAALDGAEKPLYIGDSETDAETAVAANITFLLYTEGYRKTPVADLPHSAAFSHFDALPDLVRSQASSV
ncbi:HAD-IA family hydrolase [Marinovum sp. 2_MG-2023]|uniref:HAD-IA family hydrolase n=1 Tax=Roseobacteraceae TaxID=2854170 RepID=UPI001FD1CF3E|nr:MULTISPECIES: HAD-IA family hydrolase [Roseobacteraceae]MCJ7872578.1 HAD-IA family hydrolase [Phaeobacter sp. J2-8]MDO6730261.1 HAD-IA family hydrolase [Marinovum sp. 2_MG-2023]MDO6778999.1 HAD-IA family hydrolase [Marinovum sp. 1_MG-2023]